MCMAIPSPRDGGALREVPERVETDDEFQEPPQRESHEPEAM